MDTLELIKRSQQGDKAAREQVILDNVGLVWSIVRRFMGRGQEPEDLFQIGSIGLMKAVDHFDLNYDVKFSTYAVPMISGEIKRFLRDDGMVKVSRSMKENYARICMAGERMRKELGREVTLPELAQDTGLAVEDIVLAMEACQTVESLSEPIHQKDGSETTLGERLTVNEDETEQLLNHVLMEQLLAELGEMEQKLIILRYFQSKTQTEVAKRFGISQVQVSRLEKKILEKLRDKIA